jgi:hypothetical protein
MASDRAAPGITGASAAAAHRSQEPRSVPGATLGARLAGAGHWRLARGSGSCLTDLG